jgi:tRNA A37 threonylcarbamoyladenosine dehydratase
LPDRFSRTSMIIGKEGLARLMSSKVAIFGLGGVGSYVVEGLARAGIGHFYLVDFDLVEESNINRQIHALTNTLGRFKAELMAERILQINPEALVCAKCARYLPGKGENMIPVPLDYLVDAVDDVAAKVDLITYSVNKGIPVISAMGTGNKLEPKSFEVADITQTSVCPLARVVRRRLREAGISRGVKVVYSKEIPLRPFSHIRSEAGKANAGAIDERVCGSISFVPSVAGLIIAGEVVKDLLEIRTGKEEPK